MCWFTQPSKFRAISYGFDPVGMVLCNDVVTTLVVNSESL